MHIAYSYNAIGMCKTIKQCGLKNNNLNKVHDSFIINLHLIHNINA